MPRLLLLLLLNNQLNLPGRPKHLQLLLLLPLLFN